MNMYSEVLFKRSFEYFKKKDFNESKKILLPLLNEPKPHENIFFLMGLINIAENKFNDSIKYFNLAIKKNPNNPLFYYNTALAYDQTNKRQKAILFYKKCLNLDKKNFEAWINYGNILKKINKFQESIDCYQNALRIRPEANLALLNISLAFFNINKVSKGINILKKIPKNSKINKQIETSIALGYLLNEEYNEGLILSNSLIENDPNNFTAITNRGIILNHLGKFKEAVKDFSLILKINPNNTDALSNMGLSEKRLGNYKSALKLINSAIEKDGSHIEAHCIKAGIFNDLNDNFKSSKYYKKALSINKNHPEANFGLALNYLTNLEFESGWKYFDWRFIVQKTKIHFFKTEKKIWDGKNLNKKLFIWGEQGLGDQILFGSLLKNFINYPEQIVIQINEKIIKLFQRSFPQFKFIANMKLINNYDYDQHISFVGLGKVFIKNINYFKNNNLSFLKDNPELTKKIKSMFVSKKIICGLSWKSINVDVGSDKSLNIKELNNIFKMKEFDFINLQYGDVKDDISFVEKNYDKKIQYLKNIDLFSDVDSASSIIVSCDIIITTSNTTAHLSGALGKITYLLIPLSRGKLWYWTDIKGKSYWYPSIKIFKQTKQNSWKEPINKMIDSIKKDIIKN